MLAHLAYMSNSAFWSHVCKLLIFHKKKETKTNLKKNYLYLLSQKFSTNFIREFWVYVIVRHELAVQSEHISYRPFVTLELTLHGPKHFPLL